MMKVGFSRPKKFKILSWFIMKFLGTKYSHAFLVFDVESTKQDVVYHATHKGVNCLELETFLLDNEIVISVDVIGTDKRTSALHFCIRKLGLPYSVLTILAIRLKLKFNDNEKAFICSELVARALGIDFKNIDRIDPKQLLEILNAKN